MPDFATLNYDGKNYNLPLAPGPENEKAIDNSKLRKDSGLVTLDYGYTNTGSTKSQITFVDGEKGILRYRGYNIEDLAAYTTFPDTAWLLIYGNLPTREELGTYSHL